LIERKQFSSDQNSEFNKEEKVRDSQNAIKSIQILMTDFKNDYSNWPNWDEFKRSERQFNELVDDFHILIEADNQGPLRPEYSDDEDETPNQSMMSRQQACMIEENQVSIHNIMDQEDMIKERGERIQNINQNAVTVNSLATEINHGIFDTGNMIENIVKNTFDANQNLLKANKQLESANHRSATRRNLCLRLVVTMA